MTRTRSPGLLLVLLSLSVPLAGLLPGHAAAQSGAAQPASASHAAPDGVQQDALSLPGGPKDPTLTPPGDDDDGDASAATPRYSPWSLSKRKSRPTSQLTSQLISRSPSQRMPSSSAGAAAGRPADVFPSPWANTAYPQAGGQSASAAYRPPW